MRVLVCSDYYPPFIGGGHRATRALARRLQAAGHVVTVATVSHPCVPRRETDGGVEVRRLPHLRALLRPPRRGRRQEHHAPFPDPLTALALRRLLRETRPAVVYAYGWIAYSAALARLGTRVPLVLGAHDYGFTCPTRTLVRDGAACPGPGLAACLACAPRTYGRPKGWLTALTVLACRPLLRRSARGLHSVSAYVDEVTARDLLRGCELPVRRTLPSFSEETDDEGSPEAIARAVAGLPGRPFILFVGALRRVKGVDVLLDAYARLDDPPPLVLLGTVESDSPASWPDGVVVVEDVPHGAVMQAWGRCLFGVAPSRWPEPLGLVVHEGMSRGRAVIGTRPGGHADLIADGETGLLVPAGDVAALAGAMRTLLARPDLRGRLGAAARVRAAETSADRLLPAYEALLREVAGSRP
jgi:glycosyltransferase involved in cell wall biosynthesis